MGIIILEKQLSIYTYICVSDLCGKTTNVQIINDNTYTLVTPI